MLTLTLQNYPGIGISTLRSGRTYYDALLSYSNCANQVFRFHTCSLLLHIFCRGLFAAFSAYLLS